MNGFTNAILSLLLGWIRLLINQLWKLMNSERGVSLLSFLAHNWIYLLVILGVGGFLVDRIVYVLRWRPYYLWRGKRRREAAVDEPLPVEAGFIPDPAADAAAYDPNAAYQRPPAVPIENNGIPMATNRYAPAYRSDLAPGAPRSTPYVPPADLTPVYDEDPVDWPAHHPEHPPLTMAEVMENVQTDFGTARPEPVEYLRDMQAGFARPLPPEQLYAAPAAPPEPYAAPSIHPGLDGERIRENVGLSPAGPLPEEPAAPSAPGFPTFAPFASADAPSNPLQPTRARNPFATLAKKARDFVGVGDENDPRTIHDLQSTVDVRNAFHEPVYPKPRTTKEDDDLSIY